MKLKRWHIIYGVSILVIDGIFLAANVDINRYIWIFAGILTVLLFINYNVLTNAEQSRANSYLDQITGVPKDKEKIMPVGRFLIMIAPIAFVLCLNYLIGV